MSDLDDILGGGGLKGALDSIQKEDESAKPPPPSPALDVATVLGIADKARDMGGNSPFSLAEPDGVWLILKGSVDIFLLRNRPAGKASELLGERHHVMRVNTGGSVFGFCDCPADTTVIAVPANGSRLVSCKANAYFDLARKKEMSQTISKGVDVWCASFLKGISAGPPPRKIKVISPCEEMEIAAQTVLHPKLGVLWVWDSQNSLCLFDQQDGSGRPLPLSLHSWGRLNADARVSAATTAMRLEGASKKDAEAVGGDLESFHAIALKVLDASLHDAELDERQRFALREKAEAARFNSALSSLGSVLGARHGVPLATSADPLLAACQVLAQETGISVPDHIGLEKQIGDQQDKVQAFARYGGFFVRQIVLEGTWWVDMQMPVLATYEEDEKPCVILPSRGGSCVLVDPVRNIQKKVTSQIAATIGDQGHVFYAPLPAGKLKPMTLLRFGLRGTEKNIPPIILMILAGGLLSLATPVVTSWILDPIIPEAQLSQLGVMIAALVLVGITMTVFSLVQSIIMLRMEGVITHRVQAAVWDRLLNLPASFFRKFTVGDLVNRAQGIDSMRQMLTEALLSSFTHGVIGLFSFGLMLYYNWKLSLFTLLVAVVYGVISYFFGRSILTRTREVLKLSGHLQGVILQLLSAVRKIRITGSERSAFAHWAATYATLQSITFDQRKLNNALVVFKSFFSFLAIFVVLLILSWEAGDILDFYHTTDSSKIVKQLTIMEIMPTAHFVAFHVAFGQFMSAVFGLTGIVIQLLTFKPLYERVEPILDAELETDLNSEDPGDVVGDVEVCDVQFRYEDKMPLVLKGISFAAKPGEYIALTGPSGAGKSTLIRLLLGFDQPESGSVYLDGRDVGKLDKRSMRRNFGVVLQNGRLLSGSIFHNITAGANLTRDDAWEAARQAGLDKDIEAMPMGMDTFLGEGASTLSGGQRQRLMIARALIHKPRIMLFDEATSALDNEVQNIVMGSLDALSNTRIVVAHRLSTIINADRIYVIDQGQVVESGAYHELMDMKGLFYEMAIRQIA